MHPAGERDGYAVFVRCTSLSAKTAPGAFVATVNALDGILHAHIKKADGDFFPNPFGGAIRCDRPLQAMDAAQALIEGLAGKGIPAGIGIAWGSFQRVFNVDAWNAASSALNYAARLAFSQQAAGGVLIMPKAADDAGGSYSFGPEFSVDGKGMPYRCQRVESPRFSQRLGDTSFEEVETEGRYVVLWDIVKYSTRHPDEQTKLARDLAETVTRTLQTFGAGTPAYSPAGDGGYAVVPHSGQAFEVAKFLLKHSDGIDIRVGIHHGIVAKANRGWVGGAVLRADHISSQAEGRGIAILEHVWNALPRKTQEEWFSQRLEADQDVLALRPRGGSLSRKELPLVSASSRLNRAPIKTELDLLQANRKVTSLLGRQKDLADLHTWLRSPAKISVRTLTGKGGAGKTRLALEFLCETEKDWHAGFLLAEDFQRFIADPGFRQWRWERPTLIVLDYAGQVHEKLKEWLKALAVMDTAGLSPLRFLLLERDASPATGWYQAVTSIRDSFTTSAASEFFNPLEPVEITPLRDSELRREILRETLDAAEQHLARPRLGLPENDTAFEDALRHHQWSEPLALMMAALYSVETGTTKALMLGRAGLALKLAGRERNRIAAFAPEGAADLMIHMAACATLSGGFTRDEAIKTARRESEELGETYPGGPGALVKRLADALPGGAGAIAPVTPDLIGEALLTLHLEAHGSGAFHRCLELKPKEVIEAMIRTAQDFWRQPLTLAFLSDALAAGDKRRKLGIWKRLSDLGKTTALRQVQLEAEIALGELALSADSPSEHRAEWLDRLSKALGAAGRREEALAAGREAVEICRRLAQGNPKEWHPALAGVIHNLALRLRDMGCREESLAAAREALQMFRALADADPGKFRPYVAMATGTLATALNEVGRRDDALTAAREAVDLRRTLALSDPDAHRSDLAPAITNLATLLAGAGRHREALAAGQEAVDLFRTLAKENPDAFLPDLAASTSNVAVYLGELGFYEKALAATTEVTALRRDLARMNPEAFLPDLGSSLHNLAIKLAEAGRREEALAPAQEAVDLRRGLARTNPGAFLRDLASSLVSLANRLRDAGRTEDALAPAQEAVDLYHTLAATNPGAFRAELALSLSALAGHLSELGRYEDALRQDHEAAGIRRALAQEDPDVFLPELASSANNLADTLRALGRIEEALTAAKEAVSLRRDLAQSNPDAILPDLIRSLSLSAQIHMDAGLGHEAAALSGEALVRVAPLFVKQPRKFAGLVRGCLRRYRVALKWLGQGPAESMLPALTSIKATLEKLDQK